MEWKYFANLHNEQIEEGLKFANELSSSHGALYNWRGNSFSRWTRGLFTRRKNMGNLDISSLKHV